MVNPNESSLLELQPPHHNLYASTASSPPYPPGEYKPINGKHVDVNAMKRNMSIAKGFMDISLMTANANQLKTIIYLGDSSSYVFYVLLSGLILSLILQVLTGFLLILKERFNINNEDDHKSADLYNNIVLLLVFITLLLNVFVSSFGTNVVKH